MPKERLVQQPATSAAQAHFSQVPSAEIERSTFDRSHGWKGTIETCGQLVPVYWDEILPGDTFNMSCSIFMRLATPLHPFMDNLKGQIHFFFVPNRLLWEHWINFMGEQRGQADDPADYSIPTATFDLSNPGAFGTVGDYLGLPIGQTGVLSVSDLPFRCYDLIWYEWYRDQNIHLEDPPPIGDGATDRTLENVRHRMKRKDYFTSALPWPQKGDPVTIPLGTEAPVQASGTAIPTFVIDGTGNERLGWSPGGDASSVDFQTYTGPSGSFIPMGWDDPALEADLSTATAVTINDLRTAFQIQRLLERDARGGTRYIEIVLSHFGVQSDDARMQRPEYLGMGHGNININPVAATVAQPDTPQGTLAAVGTGLIKGGFTHSFTEHGLVMGLLSVQADQTYQHGVERYWHRLSRNSFYWPAFAHLGEQPIWNGELWYGSGDEAGTWGYQERHGDYRYKQGRICTEFRSNHPQSLDVWHLAQDFDQLPELNKEFIGELPPIDRVIAVPAEPDFLVDAWFNLKCTRPMPVYAVPGMIDHF